MKSRTFNYSDDILLEYAGIVAGHLENDLSRFAEFDADLNPAKADKLNTLIEEVFHQGTDRISVGDQKEQTETMLRELEKSRRLFNQLRYWIVKAFASSKATQERFGIGNFSRDPVRNRMVEFMQDVSVAIDKYRDQLEAAGASRELLDEVIRQAQSLEEANRSQELSKGGRAVDTAARVERLNEIFDHLRAFNNAAEFVFIDEPVRREFYRPPSRNQSVEEEIGDVG